MTNFTKIHEYKGRITGKWRVPDNHRRWVAGANKLLKLYHRCSNTGLLWTDLVDQLKQVVTVWEKIGRAKYSSKIDPQYWAEFDEIQKFDVVSYLSFQKNIAALLGNDKVETHIEEKRERVDGHHCNFCRCRLVYPAYVIYRINTEVVHRSEAVGIVCLHNVHGKLQKLLEKEELRKFIDACEKVAV